MKDAITAKLYDVDESSIRRWRSLGKLHSNPCPLTDPLKMSDWWESMVEAGVLKKGVPVSIQAAASRLSAAMPGLDDDIDEDGDAPSPRGGADPEIESLLADIQAGQVFDYSDGIAVAQRNVQVSDLLLMKAIRAGNESKIGALSKRLNEAQDSLRTLLKDRGKIQADAGEVLPRHEVRSAMVDLHGTITKRFRHSLKNAFLDFAEVPLTRESWNAKVDEAVDNTCAGLLADGFQD